MRRVGKRSEVRTGRLRAADPFELIRWLARSQTDPRKALAELVQNSLDAGARRVAITRVRERGVTALRILDDGDGVIPDVERPEALAHVATHIGHSRKRNLTPEQRRELMLQGQYGIGLLGFWPIGAALEMRSQVGAGDPWVLRMWEDRPSFEIAPVRGRFALEPGTWTEVVVRQLHRPAFVTLTGRRVADYLAGELRGQLLARGVDLTVHDRIARGTAPKVRRVEPVRFTGARLPAPETLPVDGFGPMRVELYLVPEGNEHVSLSVSCGGTVVYDDLADALDGRFRRQPWTSERLSGLLEFPDFAVAPGSRRGVLLDEAAQAFAVAVERELEPVVRAALAAEERRRIEAVETDLVQKLERAFRDLPREAPEYDLFAVRHGAMRDASATPDLGSAAHNGLAAAIPSAATTVHEEEPPALLPAGPLARVEIRPARPASRPSGGATCVLASRTPSARESSRAWPSHGASTVGHSNGSQGRRQRRSPSHADHPRSATTPSSSSLARARDVPASRSRPVAPAARPPPRPKSRSSMRYRSRGHVLVFRSPPSSTTPVASGVLGSPPAAGK